MLVGVLAIPPEFLDRVGQLGDSFLAISYFLALAMQSLQQVYLDYGAGWSKASHPLRVTVLVSGSHSLLAE
jgi:hypothetical protein